MSDNDGILNWDERAQPALDVPELERRKDFRARIAELEAEIGRLIMENGRLAVALGEAVADARSWKGAAHDYEERIRFLEAERDDAAIRARN